MLSTRNHGSDKHTPEDGQAVSYLPVQTLTGITPPEKLNMGGNLALGNL